MEQPERYQRRDAVYLHFLDRELTEAAGRYPAGFELIRAVRILIFLTQSQLYCGLSAIWENDRISQRGHEDFEALFRHSELQTVSRDYTLAEFRSSRAQAYEHDRGRYPNYYTASGDRLGWLTPTWPKVGGSTAPLVRSMQDWVRELPARDGTGARFEPVIYTVRKPVMEGLHRRETEAITYSYFRRFLGSLAENPHAEFIIRRQISVGFTIDNQRHGGGDIATGIPELVFFDKLALDFPHHDVRLLGELAAVANLGSIFDPVVTDADKWDTYIASRSTSELRLLAATVHWLITALYARESTRSPGARDDPSRFHGQHQVRARIISRIRVSAQAAARPNSPDPSECPEEVALRTQMRLLWLADHMASDDPELGLKLNESRGRIGMMQADVVLVTVNEAETSQLQDTFESAGYLGKVEWGPINTYRLFGTISGATVAHVRCTMGSGGQGGSTLTVTDAIRDLKPSSIIGVGVAFGMDEAQQPIGQLLLSQKLTSYELQWIGADESATLIANHLGPSVESSPRLLGRFRDGHLGVDALPGEMLSGEKLIDNAEFKRALLDRFPGAVGGEMEGAGVQAASGRSGVDWIIVKAVCDYAEHKAVDQEKRQLIAARNAARAVLNVVERGGLNRP